MLRRSKKTLTWGFGVPILGLCGAALMRCLKAVTAGAQVSAWRPVDFGD